MKISEHRKSITKQLSVNSDTPQIDADLLLMHCLKITRTELLTRLNDVIHSTELEQTIQRRVKGEPMAYILGHQPFWTMDLLVTNDVLIPRPETECLVEWILHHFANHDDLSIADLGTGSGAIAIALASEKKHWHIDATDQSYEALSVAKKNADLHHLKNISFYQGDWCDALPSKKYDIIISNPPYIAEHDAHLKKLTFEPLSALVSGKQGLDAIHILTHQSTAFLAQDGYLVIEHGYDQAESAVSLFESAGFSHIQSHRDLSDNARFVSGQL